MYSQNDEERYILDFFAGQTGRFLDIGAFDGKRLSNTFALAERGWEGVCIEPSPSVFLRLLETHKGNDRIILINGALHSSHELLPFYDSNGDAVSSLDNAAHLAKWNIVPFTKFFVPTLDIAEFAACFGWNFQFINLDVEGNNVHLLENIPLQLCNNLRMLCIEHDSMESRIMDILAPYHFKRLAHNAENLILTR